MSANTSISCRSHNLRRTAYPANRGQSSPTTLSYKSSSECGTSLSLSLVEGIPWGHCNVEHKRWSMALLQLMQINARASFFFFSNSINESSYGKVCPSLLFALMVMLQGGNERQRSCSVWRYHTPNWLVVQKFDLHFWPSISFLIDVAFPILYGLRLCSFRVLAQPCEMAPIIFRTSGVHHQVLHLNDELPSSAMCDPLGSSKFMSALHVREVI